MGNSTTMVWIRTKSYWNFLLQLKNNFTPFRRGLGILEIFMRKQEHHVLLVSDLGRKANLIPGKEGV